jgi:pyruvate dehydrogenase complex dihydrolipoamide acetyltransferase long form
MLTEFKLPELGENIASGDIVNVLVHEGEEITANQGVVELETEKAVVEIPCPHAGKIVKLQVKKGDTVKVGQVVLTLEAEAAAGATAGLPSSASAAADAPTDAPGTAGQAGHRPEVGRGAEPSAPDSALTPAGPAVRRLARELGVDLGRVRGSGPHGRILAEDVRAATGLPGGVSGTAGQAGHRPEVGRGTPLSPSAPMAAPGEPGRDAWGPVRRERMPRIRRTIAQQMARAASIIPHVTNFDDADITDLEALRASVPAGYLDQGVRLTLLPFVMKAIALALRRHPTLNASLDEEKGEVVYKEYVNLGVAVDTPRGLVVPVVRDADRLTVAQLAQAVAAVAQRSRAAQFAPDELRGGTFTLSNLGAVGGAYSTPIINHPEVAILLLGRARRLPVAGGQNSERLDIRLMLPLSLSYDHRLVDGAAAARFLNDVIDYLQSPARLLM